MCNFVFINPRFNNFITRIKFINLIKLTAYILLLLLLCLKSYAEQSSNNIDKNELTQELLLAEFAINNNQQLKALEIYQKLAIKTNDPKIAKRAVELALNNGQDLEALKTVIIWADAEPKVARAQLLASLLVMQYQGIDESSIYLNNLLNAKDENIDTYMELLFNHPFEQDKLLKLGSILEKIYKDSSLKQDFNGNLALSLYNEKVDDGGKSLEYINIALKLSPESEVAHIHKIRLLNIYKSTDESLEYLENTIALFPKNYELRKLYADILYDLEQWPKAKKHYNKLVNNEVYKEEVLLQLAYINITNNDTKAAKKHFLKLTESSTYGSIANYYLGLIAQQMGQNDQALESFSKITDGEYLIRSKVRISTILTEQKKYEEAKQAIDSALTDAKAVDIDGYIKEIVLSEAELLYQQGLFQDAMAILDNIKTHYPDDSDIYYSIGILANKLNNYDLFTKNMKLVISQNPNNSDALSALGWYYYKQDNNKEAYSFLEKAYSTDNFNSSKIGARFGAVLWKSGERERAAEVWQKILELDPSNQAIRDMINKTKSE